MCSEDVNANDLVLIRRCRAGDVEAFGDLVTRHQDRLYGTLVQLLGSLEDAREVSQDAFVLAFRKLNTFRGDSAFYSWLFRIAYNAAMTRRRKDRRRNHASMESVKERTGGEPSDERDCADPAHSLESRERQEMVREALGELAEEYRTPLVLKEIEGLRYDEIADLIGCPIGTVRSRIHRARKDLKERLSRAIRSEI